MRILSIVGARPQFVKAFPVSRRLRREHEEVLVHTGQHYDEALSDVFFDELDIPEPDYHLGVGSDTHASQTASMMTALEDVQAAESPDLVLVYGDTNSTLAGALVAAKSEPALAHVEAGLRSDDWEMPEEVNRVLTDHASDLLFAPTEAAVEGLRNEGITDGVHLTGDVMYDAIERARERAVEHSTALADLGVAPGEYVLATVHRARNTDDPERLSTIVSALSDAPLPVVFPAHPRTTDALERHGLLAAANEATILTDPVGYLDFVALLSGAERVATDSGGVQKEAFFVGTPCVTLRETTEWLETVDAGWNVLVGADGDAIRAAIRRPYDPPPKPDLYGDGDAADRIAAVLAEWNESSEREVSTEHA